jgi:ribosomal protein S18 acetylase RimI-like enzyme
MTHIYVDPAAQDGGIGQALLDHAKRLRPERIELWVFQKNAGARRFYERHGFRLVRLTDGADNMEKEPDALYEWLPSPVPARAA